MKTAVEKKSKAKTRQAQVAVEYRSWLAKNPQADRERRIRMLDAISDSAYLTQMLNERPVSK